MNVSLNEVLGQYGLPASAFSISRVGSGHINHTYKVSGTKSFILQRVNNRVFVRPERIERNIQLAKEHLAHNHPSYLFLAPLPATNRRNMVYDHEGFPWRLYPFLENSHTIDEAKTTDQAFKAAREFGRLTTMLQGCDPKSFEDTIPQFHDLAFRYSQFEEALEKASAARRREAEDAIQLAKNFSYLVGRYSSLIAEVILVPRVFHNDTKINNVLFDEVTGETLAVIDLDTLMSGYFIYDLGDLLRTIVPPVSEEEPDLTKVVFRKEFYSAVIEGYRLEVEKCLTVEEKNHFGFAGPMMTYIMSLRFLADFLRGNTYYQISYSDQNLVRSRNQLKLVELFLNQVPD